MTVSNFAVAGRPLQQSAADRSLDKSVGVMFHHLADLVKIFHVIDFRHAGKLPDTLVQKRQLHPFLAFFLQGRSFFPVFFFLTTARQKSYAPFLLSSFRGGAFSRFSSSFPTTCRKSYAPFLLSSSRGQTEKNSLSLTPRHHKSDFRRNQATSKILPQQKSPPSKTKPSAGPAHIRKSSHITDSHNQSSGL